MLAFVRFFWRWGRVLGGHICVYLLVLLISKFVKMTGLFKSVLKKFVF